MKPCSQNRKLIACLVMDALEPREAQPLRLHLEKCETCRHYYEEVSHAAQKLNAFKPSTDIHASNAFHQRVMGALRAEERIPAWQMTLLQLQRALLNWRVALPVMGTAAILITALCLSIRQPNVPAPTLASAGNPVPNASVPKPDPEPTISNYQTVANHSLEKLDELLTRQGTRTSSSTPVYTASSLAQVNALE
jgi:anti-sigma factor RsiW